METDTPQPVSEVDAVLEEARTLYDKGSGNFALSSEKYRAAIRLLEDTQPQSDLLAQTYLNLAFVLFTWFDSEDERYPKDVAIGTGTDIDATGGRPELLENALQSYEQALAIWQELNDLPKVAGHLSNLGSCYYVYGQADEGLSKFEQSLALVRTMESPSAESVAASYNKVAQTYIERGRLDEAEPILEEGLRALGPCEPMRSYLLEAKADVLESRAKLLRQEAAAINPDGG